MKDIMRISTRRDFLLQAASFSAAFPLLAHSVEAMTTPVRRVHVIFKTHLDIGFTDLAENVIKKYVCEFIPTALELARETREQHGQQRFKWSIGSWLMHIYLEQSESSERKRMEQAIAAEEICWHALPFTMHSEVLDPSVFEAGLQISRRLDERFGKCTVSGKMTDVPGHTRGVVPILQRNGVSLLHIGVNLASMPPDVPPVFVWQARDGERIAVMYQKEYGGIMPIPHTSDAVAIMFTGDNHGPQTPEEVVAAYAHIQAQFPGADVFASDLNAVANTITGIIDQLPVVTQELGDSWIHGIGSDPLKIAQLRALSRRRKTWLDAGSLQQHSDSDLAFCLPLCMVGEHTWGLDIKTHLQAWDVYTPEALANARGAEPFWRVEASWQEKRNYIHDAVHALPEPLKGNAEATLNALAPTLPEYNRYAALPTKDGFAETDALSCALDPVTGAIVRLQNKHTGREWAAPQSPLALFAYQTFSVEDYDRFMDQYLTSRPEWALKDFGKPGLEAFGSSFTCLPRVKALWQREEKIRHTLLVELTMATDDLQAISGCPAQIFLEYHIHKDKPVLDITVKWFGKKANRLPEAFWFSFVPTVSAHGAWSLDKMGEDIDPCDVVRNGGHKLHAIKKALRYADEKGIFQVNTLDAPLVSPGQRSLLNFDNVRSDPGEGMHVCLYNNVWGTNFVMWFDEDMQYRFSVTC